VSITSAFCGLAVLACPSVTGYFLVGGRWLAANPPAVMGSKSFEMKELVKKHFGLIFLGVVLLFGAFVLRGKDRYVQFERDLRPIQSYSIWYVLDTRTGCVYELDGEKRGCPGEIEDTSDG